MIVHEKTMINEPAAQAGAGAAAMRVDAPATGTPAPQGAGAEQGGYVMFTYVRRKVYWDGSITDTLSAIIASSPQAVHSFKRLISRLLLTRREIAYYAFRRGVKVVLLTTATDAPNAIIKRALQRAGIPLERALPLGEVLPRLPEWLRRGLAHTEAWTPRRPRKALIKEVPPPREWPFNPERAAVAVYRIEWVKVYEFKRRIVIYLLDDNVAISIDRTAKPEELLAAAASLPEELLDLLLQRREEIAEAVPELRPFLELISLFTR